MAAQLVSAWHSGLAAPAVSHVFSNRSRALLSRFENIDPTIEQPGLSEHIVSIHLGGPKRMRRWHHGRMTVHDITENSITVMPALEANSWQTEGPVAFAHLSISPGLVAETVGRELERDPRGVEIVTRVGRPDLPLAGLYHALMREQAVPFGGSLHVDALITALVIILLREHSSLGSGIRVGSIDRRSPGRIRGGLSGWQLRRVVDYLHAHLGAPVRSGELVELTGLSRAQFFLSFKQSTGETPHAFLRQLRAKTAVSLLVEQRRSPDEVAHLLGFADVGMFRRWFRAATHMSPEECRRAARSGD